MSTLLLRLAAPLQAWGSDAKFDRRGTERVPTKSGVIGLIAAAQGRRRDESVADLATLRFGVRVDQEGKLLRDFHIAQRPGKKDPYVSHRYYLADAVFLVGLEGDDATLADIDEAIRRPAYPLFLGRRSCPPEGQVPLGIRRGKSLIEALEQEPLQASNRSDRLRLIYDAGPEDAFFYLLRDNPISFNPEHRQHGFRRIAERTIENRWTADQADREPETDHDPFSILGG